MKNEEIADNLSLVISVKEIKQRLVSELNAISKADNNDTKIDEINWGVFSTRFSLEGLIDGLDHTTDLEDLAEWVHAYWVACLEYTWELIEDGEYHIIGGYTDEKRASHNLMRVSFDQLSREDQLKDIYVIKSLLTESEWLDMGGDIYEDDFERYDIGW